MKRLLLIGLLIGTAPAVFCNDSAAGSAADQIKNLEEENKALKEQQKQAEQQKRKQEEADRKQDMRQSSWVEGCFDSLFGISVSTAVGGVLFGKTAALSFGATAGIISGITGYVKKRRADIVLCDKNNAAQDGSCKKVLKALYDEGLGAGLMCGPVLGVLFGGLLFGAYQMILDMQRFDRILARSK